MEVGGIQAETKEGCSRWREQQERCLQCGGTTRWLEERLSVEGQQEMEQCSLGRPRLVWGAQIMSDLKLGMHSTDEGHTDY